MQIFNTILNNMKNADQNFVDDGYNKERPRAFGMVTGRVSSSKNLNGLERQFRSPSYQP